MRKFQDASVNPIFKLSFETIKPSIFTENNWDIKSAESESIKSQGSRFTWDLNTVKELEALEHLEILTITTYYHGPGAEQLLTSQRLMSCTQSLLIESCNLKSSGISLVVTMDKLREFTIYGCILSEIKMARKCSFLSLSKVRIAKCKGLREMTFLMLASNLKNLEVNNVCDLEDIINKEKACEVENSSEMILLFPKLNHLRLLHLPMLKSIHWSPLPFPCLEKVQVVNCPNLKKLPLDSKSGDNGLIIEYREKKWFEGVEWEDEATKTHFLSSCQSEDMFIQTMIEKMNED